MENTMIGGEDSGGLVAAALNLQEHQDSSWLNIDHFPDSDLGFENNAPEDKCQRMGNVEDKLGSDGAKDGQEMDYNIDRVEDGPGDDNGVAHSGKDIIADSEMDGIEVDDGGRSYSEDGHKAGVGGNVEGRWHLRSSFVSGLTL